MAMHGLGWAHPFKYVKNMGIRAQSHTSNEGHENSPPRKMIPLLKMENDPPFHFGKNNIGK